MKKRPKISIIIPVYNTEKYVGRCLDSVIDQTFRDIEVLVIDDGSTDDSPNIIKSYVQKYPFIRCFSQENFGAGAARNYRIEERRW